MSFRICQPVCAVLMLAAASLAGCGNPSGFEIAPVKGKVVFQGQPVKGGSLVFRPIAAADQGGVALGKPAGGEVSDDGTFTLTTNTEGDGAAVGKHQILYTPHYAEEKSYDDKRQPSPYEGMIPQPREIEIKSGDNDIEIELAPAA